MRLKEASLAFILLIILSCTKTEKIPLFVEAVDPLKDETMAPFFHGVASGDPLYDQVIIWTRVTPKEKLESVDVKWEVAADRDFQKIIKNGTFSTNAKRDYTVKVDVGGLNVGTSYFYRFYAFDKHSMVGRTMTAPKNAESISLGVVSCSNYEWGYFNAYGALAQENLNAIIHLGDYIYEYAGGDYGDSTINRVPLPNKELITLQDYRTRYSQYRLDKNLIAAHAMHPFINIWDDHEIANDSYKDGAQNHQPDEGSYEERKRIARKVYYEWIPIREGEKHYRNFHFGELANLIMLDERLEARTAVADNLEDPTLLDSTRTMLGTEQRNWLLRNIQESDAHWEVIGNQVVFSYLNWGYEDFNINLDSWDGYPIEQQIISDVLREEENVVLITGDTHTAWAFEVTNKPQTSYNRETGEGAFAVEFGTTSISSSNANDRSPDSVVLLHEKKIVNSDLNPHVKWTNMRDHGYMILSLDTERASAQWKFMETISEPSLTIKETRTMWVNSGEVKLRSEQ